MQTTRKTRSRTRAAVLSMVMTLMAVVLFLLPTFLTQLYSYGDLMMILGIGLLGASYVLYFFGGKSTKSSEGSKETVITVMGCRNCDYREERPFASNDYVGKDLGTCKKCPGSLYIKAIYAVETAKKQ